MMIIFLTPLFGDDLGLVPIGKDPTIETFAAKSAIEILDEGILPGTARRDVHGVAVTVMQPPPERVSDELRAIVAAQVVGYPVQ